MGAGASLPSNEQIEGASADSLQNALEGHSKVALDKLRLALAAHDAAHPSWTVYLDLQCKYSKKCFDNLLDIREKHDGKFDISIALTALPIHFNSMIALCGAHAVKQKAGDEGLAKYIEVCFANQEKFSNDATLDMTRAQVIDVFAELAAGAFEWDFKAAIADKMKNDWPGSIMPAFGNIKSASSAGVFGTPKHVIKGSLVDKTESDWTGDQWAEKLKELGL